MALTAKKSSVPSVTVLPGSSALTGRPFSKCRTKSSGCSGALVDTGLVTAVGQVLVHAPGLALCAGDGNARLLGVVKKILATLEAVVEDGVAPWGNDLDGGLEGVEAQLEADLVVTLASAAVRDGETALLLGHGNLGAGDNGTGKRGTWWTIRTWLSVWSIESS
jgi:hypothetical protein